MLDFVRSWTLFEVVNCFLAYERVGYRHARNDGELPRKLRSWPSVQIGFGLRCELASDTPTPQHHASLVNPGGLSTNQAHIRPEDRDAGKAIEFVTEPGDIPSVNQTVAGAFVNDATSHTLRRAKHYQLKFQNNENVTNRVHLTKFGVSETASSTWRQNDLSDEQSLKHTNLIRKLASFQHLTYFYVLDGPK